MNEIFEKIYNNNNTETEENILFEKVYTEAKMLNEMNPKLRKILGSAALAAALGMGTVGCSTPNDDYSEPPAIEQPANPDNPGETETETPEDTGFEDSEETETPETPSDPEDSEPEVPETPDTPETPENPEDPADSGETETETPEDTVTFETLGVSDYAESLARAIKKGTKSQLNDIVGYIDLIYKNGFIPVEFNEYNTYEDGQTYIRYIDSSDKIVFYVPESMESDFDIAIAEYKAAHAE